MKLLQKWSIYAILSFLSYYGFSQKNEGLALTPPMGWNSWNTFRCDVNESLIMQVADQIITSGMKDAGYVYVVIDDCWSDGRDSLGNLRADKKKFPSGIKALADYVHQKGLKIGIYSDAGAKTCGGYAGSRGHEYQDAQTFAEWGIDYLKYDWCNTDSLNAYWAYTTMRDAIYATKRPIIFSMCEWGDNQPWLWAKDIGHQWRVTGDIAPCFDCEVKHQGWSDWGVMKIVNMRKNIRQYSGPDHWNDFDMMEVGNGMNFYEDQTHFALWCLLSSPLIAGNDVRNMSEETKAILTNKEAISVNQDKFGIQAFKFYDKDSIEIWAKPLENNNWAIGILNRSMIVKSIHFNWKDYKIIDDIFNKEVDFSSSEFSIFDIYQNKNIGSTDKVLLQSIESHQILFYKLTRLK